MNEIERTEIARMEYYGLIDRQVCDVAGRDDSPTRIALDRFANIQQQIESEEDYPSYPPHTQEDFMYDRVNELAADPESGIDIYEAHQIFANWIIKRRPDTKVIHLGEQVSEKARFYE